MMRASHRVRLDVESIESRTLLNATPLTAPRFAAVADISTRSFPPPLLLSGRAQGGAPPQLTRPDVGTTYMLGGQGWFSPMGAVQVRGSVFTSGSVLPGPAGGRITLSNRNGTVEIRLNGPTSAPPNTLPRTFEFTVVRATGRFTALKDTGGVAELRLGLLRGYPIYSLSLNPVTIAPL